MVARSVLARAFAACCRQSGDALDRPCPSPLSLAANDARNHPIPTKSVVVLRFSLPRFRSPARRPSPPAITALLAPLNEILRSPKNLHN